MSFAKRTVILHLFLMLSVVPSFSLWAQSDEVRPADVEELSKDAGNLKAGLATVFLSIHTVDGLPLEPVKATIISTRKSPSGSSTSTSWPTLRPKFIHELKVNSGSITLYVYMPGFCVGEVLDEVEVHADDELDEVVTLSRGVERTIKVLDENGDPVQDAGVWVLINGTTASQPVGTDENGVAIVNVSPDRENESLSVTKSTWKSQTIKDPLSKDAFEVKLVRRSPTRISILDPDGNPAGESRAWLIGKSSSRSISGFASDFYEDSPDVVAGDDGVATTRDISGRFHTLIVESDSGKLRGVIGGVEEGKDHSLTLLKVKPVEFRLKGVPEDEAEAFVKRVNVRQRYSNGCKIPVPFSPSEDGLGVVAQAVEGKELTVTYSASFESHTESLYDEKWRDEGKPIILDVASLFKPAANVTFTFEHDGVPVNPKGTLGVRTIGRDNVWRMMKACPIEDGKAKFESASDLFLVENDGLMGYAVVGDGKVTRKTVDGNSVAVVKVEPAGAVIGVVVDADGKKVATKLDCDYRFIDRDRSPFAKSIDTESNQRGKFVLSPIPMDTNVTIKAGEFLGVMTKELTIDAENAVQEIELVLPETAPATLVARFEDGRAAAGIRVQVKRGAGMTSNQDVGDDGKAVFRGLLVGKDEYTARIVPKSNFQYSDLQKITAGETVEFVVRRGYKLEGTVVDENGEPMPKYVVKAVFNDQSVTADGLTDEKGKFVFTRLPKEKVKLFASHRYKSIKSSLTDALTPNESEPVELVVKAKAQ